MRARDYAKTARFSLSILTICKRKHTHTQQQQPPPKKQDRILNVSKGKSNNNKGRNKFNETKIVVNTRVINNVILLRFLILKYFFM